jgi:hypothetical protein
MNTVTINSSSFTGGQVFAGTALYDIEMSNLNFFTTDDNLGVEVLRLFGEKPCRQLVARKLLLSPPIATSYPAYWFNSAQPIVTVTFGQ